MKLKKWTALALACILSGPFIGAAEKADPADSAAPAAAGEAQVAKAAKSGKARKARTVRLTKPWKQLTLTDDQQMKIKEIHGKALDEIRAIKEREEADINALLTPEQKTQLATILEEEAASRKAKAGSRKKAKPSDAETGGKGAEPAASTETPDKAGAAAEAP
jgi:Spy/CpxP family protein refolding chaperone